MPFAHRLKKNPFQPDKCIHLSIKGKHLLHRFCTMKIIMISIYFIYYIYYIYIYIFIYNICLYFLNILIFYNKYIFL